MFRGFLPMCRQMYVLLVLIFASTANGQQPSAPPAVVQVAMVSRTELAPTVAVPGTIYSRNDLQVTAAVAGQLTAVAEPWDLCRKRSVSREC